MSTPAARPVATERLAQRMRSGLLAVALLVPLALIFLLLPFKLAYSSTGANSNQASGEANREAKPEAPNYPVAVWVEEKDRLATLLRDELVEQLQASGRYQPRVLTSARPTPTDAPLLRVWIARPGLSWTPFYAQTRAEVRFGFSNYTTAIDLEKETPFTLNGPSGQYLVDTRGTLNLEDHSYGLISLPGYWHWVAEKMAAEIMAKMP